MIICYTGRPGSGKSLDVLHDIKSAYVSGKTIITNFPVDMSRIKGKGKIVVLQGKNLVPDKILDVIKNTPGKYKEDKMLLVIDECQMVFNSRDWIINRPKGWVEFFTQHRKYGVKVILVTQQITMIDKQVRGCIEYEVEHRRFCRFGPLAYVIGLLVGDFIAITRWTGEKEVLTSRTFRGSKRLYQMYDTTLVLESQLAMVKDVVRDMDNIVRKQASKKTCSPGG